ncbi:MAG: hypothetical protein JRN24_02520 [Nitrososphaerota archaeon]|nr:hypothetical protein [Nitrososphaerota archaeon]
MKPEFELRVTLESILSPSEDPEKVQAAMREILGECDCRVSAKPLSIRFESDDSGCLLKIRDQLRDRRVRGAARKLLLAGTKGRKTTVMLNRQAATVGVVALCGSEGESALGPIYLTIESDDVGSITDWMTAFDKVAD